MAGGNTTLANTGLSNGVTYTYLITNDSTPRTYTPPGNMSTAPAMPAIASAILMFSCIYDGTNMNCGAGTVVNGTAGLIGPFPESTAPSTTPCTAGTACAYGDSTLHVLCGISNGNSTKACMTKFGTQDIGGTPALPSVVGLNGTNLAGLGTGLLKNTTGTGVPSIAVAADLPAAAFGALTDGATVTWAIGSSPLANAALTFTTHGGSRTLNITNPVNGGSYVLWIKQDSTGGEGLTLGTGCAWKVSGGGSGAITPSTTASAIDVLAFTYDGTNCYANFNKNFN